MTPSKQKCDFCSQPDPLYTIPAKAFSLPAQGILIGSRGDWAACEDCFKLIEGERWDALEQRSVQTFVSGHRAEMKKLGMTPQDIEWMVHLIHQAFRKNRLK